VVIIIHYTFETKKTYDQILTRKIRNKKETSVFLMISSKNLDLKIKLPYKIKKDIFLLYVLTHKFVLLLLLSC
jgi:hypothetical protein